MRLNNNNSAHMNQGERLQVQDSAGMQSESGVRSGQRLIEEEEAKHEPFILRLPQALSQVSRNGGSRPRLNLMPDSNLFATEDDAIAAPHSADY